MKWAFQPPESDLIKILSWRNRLPCFCAGIDSVEAVTPEETAAVDNLVHMYQAEPESRFFLLEYLTDVDPIGRVLPDIIVTQIAQSGRSIAQSVREWSAFAGHYNFNSEPWRKIAIEACIATRSLTKREIYATYASLCPQGFRSSQYKVGEMNPRYQQYLDQCQQERDEESDSEFTPFRQWRLESAQEDFTRALAEFKAEHED